MNFEKAKRILTFLKEGSRSLDNIYDVVGYENMKILDNDDVMIKLLGEDSFILRENENRYGDGYTSYRLIKWIRNREDMIKDMEDFISNCKNKRDIITKNDISNESLIMSLKENIQKLSKLIGELHADYCDIVKSIELETDYIKKDYLKDKKYNIGKEESELARQTLKYKKFLDYLENSPENINE